MGAGGGASLAVFAALIAVCGGGGGAGVARPRGVPLSKAPLYSAGERFTCLDGSLTIPFSFVNDDYCDCRDGTDEPGTSACLNGVFHCANVGHEPRDLPSSRVNDGVCDCCDASDEYAGAACVDRCEELGKEAREEAARRADLVKTGTVIRADRVREGAANAAEMKERLEELRRNRAEADRLKIDREIYKAETEEREKAALERLRETDEASRAFAALDLDADGKLTLDEMKRRTEFDLDADGAVSDDEAQSLLGDSLSVAFEEFAAVSWKNVAPRFETDASIETSEAPGTPRETGEEPPEPEREVDVEPDASGEQSEEEEEGAEEHEGEESDEEESRETAEEAPQTGPEYDEETKKLVEAASEAREAYSKADRAVREIQEEIDKLESALDKDYGPEGEFASLAGRCLEYEDREYVYKLCPFDKASQRPKNGGGETDLGSWGDWTGGDGNPYSAMTYSRGASCWNGPDRSARVSVVCGLEDRIVSVAEPNRCEYSFEMETPAACVETPADGPGNGSSHDEL